MRLFQFPAVWLQAGRPRARSPAVIGHTHVLGVGGSAGLWGRGGVWHLQQALLGIGRSRGYRRARAARAHLSMSLVTCGCSWSVRTPGWVTQKTLTVTTTLDDRPCAGERRGPPRPLAGETRARPAPAPPAAQVPLRTLETLVIYNLRRINVILKEKNVQSHVSTCSQALTSRCTHGCTW